MSEWWPKPSEGAERKQTTSDSCSTYCIVAPPEAAGAHVSTE